MTPSPQHNLIGLFLDKAHELKKEGSYELARVCAQAANELAVGGAR
jgi:hypothetical protein